MEAIIGGTEADAAHAVARYRTLEAANRAVEHLSSRMDAGEVAVVPSGVRPAPDRTATLQRRAALAAAVTAGAVVAGVAAVTGVFPPLVVAGLAVGAGLLTAGISVAVLRRARRPGDEAASLLVGDAFDVTCTRRARRANHVLARWWDPAARPAPRHDRGTTRRGRRPQVVTGL